MKSVYIILIFTSLVSAEPETMNVIEIGNWSIDINDIVDGIIPQISQFIVENNLDPLKLPNTEKRLWMGKPMVANQAPKIEPKIYRADFHLHSGLLKHLSNLKRYGNATLNYENDLYFDVGFEFELLEGTYNYTLDLVFLNFKGRITALTENVRCKINVKSDLTDQTLTLTKFELQVPGKIDVIVEHKNGKVDWINTVIVNIITPFFKNAIVYTVQNEAANAIQKYFDELSKTTAQQKPFAFPSNYYQHDVSN
ncbi:uncharacterized protein LOC105425923 [Pogonomyrmex barbatus]|uniref:Uncharacterized protein LOC105425923 n=1 Tax=Pogonomyrmex barbatus TaxID=144034 RepID=A0A6I9W282_9HYME|nr:uncharacterized protein LOC105425923 [Pogonomyrmex barbatus]